MCAMNAEMRGWLAGALSGSGIALPSQKQRHIKRPDLYTSHISSSQA